MILIDSLQKKDLITHPRGGVSFGIIPEIAHYKIREGNIYLRKGDHWITPNGQTGYGVVHIWAFHEYELSKLGFTIIESVADYVAHVIQPGTPIYYETSKNPKKRVTVLRSRFGIIALEPRNERDIGFGYHVISAYPKKQARGVLVGQTQ